MVSIFWLLTIALSIIAVDTAMSTCISPHTILVSAGGTDNEECKTGSSVACLSLDYALAGATSCTLILVMSDQHLHRWISLERLQDITVEGNTTTLFCEETAGLSANHCNNLTFTDLHFRGCGSGSAAAMILNECSDVTVTECSFSDSNAGGLALLNTAGIITVMDTAFSNLSLADSSRSVVGLRMKLNAKSASANNYTISNCNFSYISNMHESSLPNSSTSADDKGVGGGIAVIVGKDSNNNVISISECVFSENKARIGSGAYLLINGHSSKNILLLRELQFDNNLATSIGGGLYIGITDPDSVRRLPLELLTGGKVTILNSTFLNNKAAHAAGLAYQSLGQANETANATTTLVNCLFEGNSANASGAAMALFKWEAGLGGRPVSVELVNCSVVNNLLLLSLAIPSMVAGNGVIYTQGIPIIFREHTVVSGSRGSAILASSATLYFYNSLTFTYNRGYRGSALSLVSGSRVVIGTGANVTFQDNHAQLYGGVLHHTFPVEGVVGMNQYCVFQYENNSITDASLWDADIWFINNTAGVSGQSLYISSSDSCQLNADGRPFTETSTYHFIPNNPQQLTSPIRHLDFSGHVTVDEDGSFHTSAMLGQEIDLNVTAVDLWNQSVNGFAAVHLACVTEEDGVKSTTYDNCHYSLGGSALIELTEESKERMTFYVKGEKPVNSSSNLVLVWVTVQEPPSVSFLYFNVTRCKLGYVYNKDLRYCECYQSDNVACLPDNYKSCVQHGYWFGEIMDDHYAPYPCPFGNCNYTVGGGCPTEQCGKDGTAHQFFCKLPDGPDSSDVFCLGNRGGIMCADCSQNHSYTFDGLMCAHNDQCSGAYILLLFFFVLLFWVLIVGILLAAVRLDLHLGSGRIYCFIFYFSVLQFFVGGTFPSFGLYVIELTLTGLIQLDPKVFGLIGVCIQINLNSIHYTMLRYANPLFLTLVVVGIILVSRRYSNINMFSRGINTVCILLYLSFLSLAFSSLLILTPVQFQNINVTYVAIEPTVAYFDPAQHLPYALVALTVEILFVIPFLTLLVLYPFLLRFKRLNLTRLKPILDEYQSCYKDHLRSFSGFYLIALQIVFSLSLFDLGSFKSIYFLQIFSIAMLTVHSVVQPYKEHWLNVQDSLLLLDLVLLSILHGNTANIVFDEAHWFKTTLVYILILLPILYMIILCLAPAVKWLLKIIKNKQTANGAIQEEISTAQQSDTTDLEREPLLFYNDSTTIINSEEQPVVAASSSRGMSVPSYSVIALSNSSNWGQNLPSTKEETNTRSVTTSQ